MKKSLTSRAEAEQKSLNTILVEALSAAAGDVLGTHIYDDLDALSGLWIDDPEFDEAIADHDQVDESLWQ